MHFSSVEDDQFPCGFVLKTMFTYNFSKNCIWCFVLFFVIKIFLRSLTSLHVPETGSALLESRESIAMRNIMKLLLKFSVVVRLWTFCQRPRFLFVVYIRGAFHSGLYIGLGIQRAVPLHFIWLALPIPGCTCFRNNQNRLLEGTECLERREIME